MSYENQSEITFDGVQQFLRHVGFDQPVRVNGTLAFQHDDTGTLVILSIPQDGRTVRRSDLMAMLIRLEKDRLADEAALAEFKSGKLPMAG
jgi:hypothetical protein